MNNDKMKLEVLQELANITAVLKGKINILSALDNDISSTGSGDLHDQLSTFDKAINSLQGVIVRSEQIVPSPVRRPFPGEYDYTDEKYTGNA